MTRLVTAELFKLRTTRTFYGIVGGALALVLAIVIVAAATATWNPGDTPLRDLIGISGFAQVFALVLGILAVTSEFRHGTITPSLLVAPRRRRFVGAKVIALASAGLVIAAVAGAVLIVTALSVAAINGTALNLGAGDWPLFAGMLLSGALWPVIGVGVGLIVRSQVAAIVGGLVWLMAIEQMVQGRLGRFGGLLPGDAGLGLFLSPGGRFVLAGALVLAAYALVAAGAGAMVLSRRDVT
jgi:ABC-2 type transport system permease protein